MPDWHQDDIEAAARFLGCRTPESIARVAGALKVASDARRERLTVKVGGYSFVDCTVRYDGRFSGLAIPSTGAEPEGKNDDEGR